jgi:hypothetical protein
LKTPEKRYLRLLVLLPHRDKRRELEAWSAKLFASGFEGAWSFPHVCPLAILSRPFSRDERKEAARRFRELVSDGDKFHTGPVEVINLAEGLSVFGPALTVDPSPDSPEKMKDALSMNPGAGKILRIVPRFVLGCGLAGREGLRTTGETGYFSDSSFPGLPSLHFRAAALANMSIDPLEGEFSFHWEIGELSWLPSPKRSAESRRRGAGHGLFLKRPKFYMSS